MEDIDDRSLFEVVFHPIYFNEGEKYWLHFKSRREHFSPIRDAYIEVDRQLTNRTSGEGKGNRVGLSYSSYVSRLLPPPHKTKCLEYESLGFESRDNCYETCLINHTLAQFTKMPFNVLTSTGSPHKSYRRLSFKEIYNDTISDQLRTLEAHCRSQCWQPDCRQEDVVPTILYARLSRRPSLTLHPSIAPQIILQFVAYMSLIDFLTNILSSVGFWVGFSPLTFLKDIDWMRLFRRYRKKV